jgi:PmbA protein
MENFTLYGREKLLNLLEDCLQNTPGDAVELVLDSEQVAVTRYAVNRIHQNVYEHNPQVWARVLVNGSLATLACNSLDPARIRETIEEAATVARRMRRTGDYSFASGNESGYTPASGAENLNIPYVSAPNPPSFFDNTAHQSPDDRAAAVAQIVEAAASAGFVGYGTYKTTVNEIVIANTKGLRAYAPATSAYLKALVEQEGQMGYAGYADALSRDAATLDPAAIAKVAVQKCRLNHDQIDLAPGDYAAVLEPNTVADMVRFIVMTGTSGMALQDGISFMAGKFGEKVTGDNIYLWEDPHHPGALPFPIDYEGQPSHAVPFIIGGKAAGGVYDRRFAAKEPGRASTGHANHPNALLGGNAPLPSHIVMQSGTKTTDELIKGVQRGLLVTRLHYTHCPDPKRVVATGTTRDGTFLIENGEIVAAVKNLRFTQSILELLETVEEFGQPKTCQDWWTANGMSSFNYYVPALRVGKCTFTGATTF